MRLNNEDGDLIIRVADEFDYDDELRVGPGYLDRIQVAALRDHLTRVLGVAQPAPLDRAVAAARQVADWYGLAGTEMCDNLGEAFRKFADMLEKEAPA